MCNWQLSRPYARWAGDNGDAAVWCQEVRLGNVVCVWYSGVQGRLPKVGVGILYGMRPLSRA